MDSRLSINEERLRRGLARERLGNALADELRRLLVRASVHLVAFEKTSCLVHGDLSGRNILVAPGDDGDWRVSGLLDWEAAFSGSTLWDLGSLFRYSSRYTEEFRGRFERGYQEAGGVLPENWLRIARLVDTTRLVETLNEPCELPEVFAECRQLIEAVVEDVM
jgi:aminoglycoside phosphotransferase (APT) family kinase protein